MREIKFRAWDKTNKRMIEDGFFVGAATGIVGEIMAVKDDKHPILNFRHDFILMQFTGLKDKNGKDLDWWGDDLLRKGSDHSCAPIGRIIYDTRKASWVIVGRSGGEFCGLWQAYENGWKKFGNIHQHPNLLEQDNDPKNSR